jgi:D-beta-D-heptose 7-phosphate kinase/D-beta-D-heptose 1-phosphate adenosyltransferase
MAANVDKNLSNLGIEVDFVTNIETITKTRYIDKKSGQHLLRVDNDRPLTPWSGRLPFSIEEYDAIVVSDYDKGFLTYEHIESLIESSVPVFIDTKKTDIARFQGAWVKVNELEYSRLRSECSGLIITRGDKGAEVPHHDIKCPVRKVEVMDVCGCGDTFLAALTYQYLMTNKIEDAIIFANKAASVSVQHRGNYAPTLEEIK